MINIIFLLPMNFFYFFWIKYNPKEIKKIIGDKNIATNTCRIQKND